MAETIGTNPLTRAEDYARAQLASSATFQRLTDSGSADEACDHIFIDDVFDPETGEEYKLEELVSLAPYAVVTSAIENGLFYVPIGVASYDAGGILSLELWLNATGHSDAAALREAKNAIGAILEEMADAAEDPGKLARPGIRLLGIARSRDDARPEEGDFVIAVCELSWGAARQGE